MADAKLAVDPRIVTGKKVKALRREGIIPAHLYGRGTESLALQASQVSIVGLLKSAGRNAVIDLQIAGEKEARPVVLRGVQRHPISGELVHLDFFQISLTETLRSDVPIVLIGEAPAVSVYGGVLLQNLDHITVEALPGDIPQHIEVDVSGLEELDTSIFMHDLTPPPNVEIISEIDHVVAKVAIPKLVVEDEVEEEVLEGEEGEEGEEGAEGEDGAEEKAAEKSE